MQNDERNLSETTASAMMLNHSDRPFLRLFRGHESETVKWGNYDLVVIDESHNFRQCPEQEDRSFPLQKTMKDIIKAGVKTKVLMLSATLSTAR